MTTTHVQQNWTAGDDWQINATLLDETGQPFDLSGAPEIKWALMNPAGQRALDEGDVNISVTDAAAGKCSIHIPAAKTSPLAQGRYSDVIRVVIADVTSTLCYGQIYVMADPWTAPVVVTAQQPFTLQAVA